MNNFLKQFLVSAIFISSAATSSARIPLSFESKKSVIAASFKAGLLAMASVGAFLVVPKLLAQKSLQDEEKANAIFFSALASYVGVAIGFLWKLRYVPEAHYTYAESNLANISQDSVLVALFSAESDQWISLLKKQFCKNQFPLLAAFNYINATHTTALECQKSLDSVALSHRTDLKMQADDLQLFASVITRFLPDVLSAISNESNFIHECSAKAQQDAAFAQMMMATYPHYSGPVYYYRY